MRINNLPSLDVHGETRSTVVYPVKEFIQDNVKMKNRDIIIIHGNGHNILKQTIQNLLKKNPYVKEFHYDGTNLGATIITLNIESKFDK